MGGRLIIRLGGRSVILDLAQASLQFGQLPLQGLNYSPLFVHHFGQIFDGAVLMCNVAL
jgi:hypothetical protein